MPRCGSARPLRRLLSRGIPLAAAAAVVLLALSLVTVRGIHSGTPAIGRSVAPTPSPRPVGLSPSPVPRYFVALDQVRVLYKYRGPCANGETAVLWTGSPAWYVIGATETNLGNQGGKRRPARLITDGHLRPLSLPASVRQTDYLTVAF